jgi:biopolymer transport protein ExbD
MRNREINFLSMADISLILLFMLLLSNIGNNYYQNDNSSSDNERKIEDSLWSISVYPGRITFNNKNYLITDNIKSSRELSPDIKCGIEKYVTAFLENRLNELFTLEIAHNAPYWIVLRVMEQVKHSNCSTVKFRKIFHE